MNERSNQITWSMPALFLLMRLVVIIALPLDGMRGFGDLFHFFRLSELGWPYLDYWVEFPPIFPFISKILYQLANGREHVYDYLLVIILSLAQMGSLMVFIKLANSLCTDVSANWRSWVYLVILLGLPYGWWYFDPLVEFLSLLAVYLLIKMREVPTGITLAIGTSLKFFPSLMLPVVWKWLPRRKAVITTVITIGVTATIFLVLYLLSPDYTSASIRSQVNKGSWETIWALIDGNYDTGNFGQLLERYDPDTALQPRGNPALIPPYLTLIPFLLLGLWIFRKANLTSGIMVVAFTGITWSIFFLWAPGWSPQWVLYLLPLILLTLAEKEALLFSVILVLLNIMEWPLLLSRGYQWGIWFTIPARTIIMIFLCWVWYKILFNTYPNTKSEIRGELYLEEV